MSIADIQSMLTGFMTDNYGHLSREIFLKRIRGPYNERVSGEAKQRLANVLGDSKIFKPPIELTLYPLVPVRIEEDYHSTSFFLIKAPSLNNGIAGLERASRIVPEQFPPVSDAWRTEDKSSS